MLKKTLALCAASAIAVLGLGAGQAQAVTTTDCFANPSTNLSTLRVDGDVYVQACIYVNGYDLQPLIRVTNNGNHSIHVDGWPNVNGSLYPAYSFTGDRAGSGWSQTFSGPIMTLGLNGSDYAQGQGDIWVDNTFYGNVYSHSVYMG
ncbi:hypothetical protein AB5J72_51050 [Streptomyces sp. CG1]|uniref:hypothetical protein n=1 Tax=Streptomyces sp. CG1 TaxID=1287523 RepID=UPI0034E2C9C0